MKTTNLTIRLDRDLNDLLTKVSRRLAKSRNEIVRRALQRYLRGSELDALREEMAPHARARGYLTDEDVFDGVS